MIVGGRSMVTSLVEFSNFVLSEMEDGLQVDEVYTDFSKAFEFTYLADLLRFESNSYPRRVNVSLMEFYHRTNYDQNEPVNKAIFNEYCGLFGFRDDISRYVFCNGFSRALFGGRSHLL
jgi:hypothetical protein